MTDNPKIITVRIFIETGTIKKFSELFLKNRLTINTLAEATGRAHWYVERYVKDPLSMRLSDVVAIADGLGVDSSKILELVWREVRDGS